MPFWKRIFLSTKEKSHGQKTRQNSKRRCGRHQSQSTGLSARCKDDRSDLRVGSPTDSRTPTVKSSYVSSQTCNRPSQTRPSEKAFPECQKPADSPNRPLRSRQSSASAPLFDASIQQRSGNGTKYDYSCLPEMRDSRTNHGMVAAKLEAPTREENAPRLRPVFDRNGSAHPDSIRQAKHPDVPLALKYNGFKDDVDPENHPILRPALPPRPPMSQRFTQTHEFRSAPDIINNVRRHTNRTPRSQRLDGALEDRARQKLGMRQCTTHVQDSSASSVESATSSSCGSLSTEMTLPEEVIPTNARLERIRHNRNLAFPPESPLRFPVFFGRKDRQQTFIVSGKIKGLVSHQTSHISRKGPLIVFPRDLNCMITSTS